MCVVTGKVGSGKSLSSITWALANDPTFNIDRVVFTPNDFMKLVKESPEKTKGKFVVADEIGSWMPSRDYMTLTNKLLSLVLQTFRYKRIGVIWTVPQLRQVDINIRTMADALIETQYVNRNKQYVVSKYKDIQFHSQINKNYMIFPVVSTEKGRAKVTETDIGRPPRELEEAYLEKKEAHMDKFYQEVHEQLGENKEHGNDVDKPSYRKCNKCGYGWYTRSHKVYVSCPNCRKNTTPS